MNKNVGSIDKTLRILVGIIILILGIVYSSWLGLIGIIPIITALVGKCPAYVPFGISTCKTKNANQD